MISSFLVPIHGPGLIHSKLNKSYSLLNDSTNPTPPSSDPPPLGRGQLDADATQQHDPLPTSTRPASPPSTNPHGLPADEPRAPLLHRPGPRPNPNDHRQQGLHTTSIPESQPHTCPTQSSQLPVWHSRHVHRQPRLGSNLGAPVIVRHDLSDHPGGPPRHQTLLLTPTRMTSLLPACHKVRNGESHQRRRPKRPDLRRRRASRAQSSSQVRVPLAMSM